MYKVLSQPIGDACDDYDERSKCSNASQRKSSNPRLPSERSGGKYEKRSHHETESKFNATQTSDEDYYLKYGSHCRVKEKLSLR